MCGRCCYNEIPVTLLDVHRMAKLLSLKPDRVFARYLQPGISGRSGLFMMQKTASRACIFLSESKRCLIHSAKPSICRLYSCQAGADVPFQEDWSGQELDIATMWEQSVAEKVSKTYIQKNGAHWSRKDYQAAMEAIQANIVVRTTQKLKVGRDASGAAQGMIYDCSRCDSPGRHARETPITLDDIQRISAFLGLSHREFFARYLADELSAGTGGLTIRRNDQCVFFSESLTACTLQQARPRHCLFTPCPRQATDTGMYDALYLGSGSVWAQFRHQAALALTRDYAVINGTSYKEDDVHSLLLKLERIVSDPSEWKRFFRSLLPYRFVNEARSQHGQREALL